MTKLMTPDQMAVKERLAAETRKRMDEIWNAPGFAEEHEAWQKEHHAAVEMCKARKRAGITQEILARRLRIPRSNVSRMENGQNVTFATFARYLLGCGYDFRITVFPVKGAKQTIGARASGARPRRRERAFA